MDEIKFYDTQILSYAFKNNKDLFSGDIRGGYISAIVAQEFLDVLGKNKKPKVYFGNLSVPEGVHGGRQGQER